MAKHGGPAQVSETELKLEGGLSSKALVESAVEEITENRGELATGLKTRNGHANDEYYGNAQGVETQETTAPSQNLFRNRAREACSRKFTASRVHR